MSTNYIQDIKVIGIGSAGCKIINTMIERGIKGINLCVVNSDFEDLNKSIAKHRIQIGSERTKGLGCGGNPDIGREAALEDKEIISNLVTGADIVFIVLGMGGGTGTGSAPVIAEVCKEGEITVIAIVSYPFSFEGPKRLRQAKEGIKKLGYNVEKLIVINGDSLIDINKVSIMDAFRKSDEAICDAVNKELSKIEKDSIQFYH